VRGGARDGGGDRAAGGDRYPDAIDADFKDTDQR
jgi:hypothetical protein